MFIIFRILRSKKTSQYQIRNGKLVTYGRFFEVDADANERKEGGIIMIKWLSINWVTKIYGVTSRCHLRVSNHQSPLSESFDCPNHRTVWFLSEENPVKYPLFLSLSLSLFSKDNCILNEYRCTNKKVQLEVGSYHRDKQNIFYPERSREPACFSENRRRNKNSTILRRIDRWIRKLCFVCHTHYSTNKPHPK